MIAEVLLVLAGQPSAFFTSPAVGSSASPTLSLSPSITSYLHPGEVASLNTLGQLAFRYNRIRSWALDVQTRSRSAVLRENASRKGKERAKDQDEESGDEGAYLSTLVAGIQSILRDYELLVVEMETKILAIDPALVQDGGNHVPMSTLVATFDPWQPVLAALEQLVTTITSLHPAGGAWTAGKLIHHITSLCSTGNPHLHSIYTTLSNGLHNLLLTHLVAFMLFGLASPESTTASPSMGIDSGADPLSPQHRLYRLNTDLFPPGISGRTRESILYVGRVAATLRREGKGLPVGLIADLRECIMAVDDLEAEGGLERAVLRARAEVGEWLWKNVLTGPQVIQAIETLGDYFLLRKADFALSLIRELHHLTNTRLLTANPRSSTAVIRDADLDAALLRASLGTSAEPDSRLDKLSFKLENGSLRPIMPSIQAKKRPVTAVDEATESGTRKIFSSALLGAPVELKYRIGWPLDLFMTPSSLVAYSEIHTYLFALRDAHTRVLDAWTRLSTGYRQRQKQGGDGLDEGCRRLSKSSWSTARAMLFFLDQLLGHFTIDIVEVQHTRLIDELDVVGMEDGLTRSKSDMGVSPAASVRRMSKHKSSLSRFGSISGSLAGSMRDGAVSPASETYETQSVRSKAPPTPGRSQPAFLDFLSLRQMHTRHLASLRDGLLLTDLQLTTLVKDIMDTCKRFAGLVDRWGGDGSPESLASGADDLVEERSEQMREVGKTFNEQLADFFRALLETQNPALAKDDASSAGTAGTSFSRTARTVQMSRLMSRQQTSFSVASARRNVGGVKGQSKADVEREDKGMEAEAAISRHIEQLLLRLDFNGVLSARIAVDEDGAKSRYVLEEGGL